MKAYRIASTRYSIFDGAGALLHSGRWNTHGRRMIYMSSSLAASRLELLVHLPTGDLPPHHAWIEVDIPDDLAVERFDEGTHPAWNDARYAVSQAYGNRWYDEQRSLALSVPSVPAFPERNILINQSHPDFARLTASAPQPLIWDERLFQR